LHLLVIIMRYCRFYTNGATYFFTLVTYGRNKVFSNLNNIRLLKKSIRIVKIKYPFEIDAIVVLPEHLHCLLTLPDGDHDFSTRIRLLKTSFSKGYNMKSLSLTRINQSRYLKQEKHVWQRRFWEHQIRNERDLNAHMDYIHYNPVKHGLVPSPKDWQHSSFLHCVAKGFYPINWGTSITDAHFDKIVSAE
jgi:putative transposase